MFLLLVTTSILTLILSSIYFISRRKFGYWKKKNVPHLPPKTFFGNYKEYLLNKKLYGIVAQEICQAFPKEPYIGAYFGTEPTLIVQDPEIIKLITTKDFYYFNSREVMDHTDKEIFSWNLFLSFGNRWKVTRQHMTPLFTSAKMKNMFHLIEKCSHLLEDMFDRECKISNVQEVRSLLCRFTMDCICSCGFGVDTNTMAEGAENNPFYIMGDTVLEVSNARSWSMYARTIWPSIYYGLGFKLLPKHVAQFFHKLITGVFKSRQYKPSSRNDFVDLILGWINKEYLTADPYSSDKKSTGKVSVKVDDDFLVAQCIVFFAAGYETSASTVSFTLYELAKDPEAQKKAIDEVDAYLMKNKNKLDYNCVTELPYLEACLDETLRLYPVLSVVTREVVEDYTLPSGLLLDKGVRIHLPVYHIHRNPKYFPEPEQYRPERFLPEQKQNVKSCTYMPFGEGQRICIGMRFAKMQTLAGLVTVLKKYRVELADGMPHKVEFEPRSFATSSKSGVRLRLLEREGWEQRSFHRQSTASN